MQNDSDRFFVLTGGPGSGKTTLIEALHRVGFATSVEAGRGIIRDQSSIGGTALPWSDRAMFAELMLSWEMRSYRNEVEQKGPVFFDRGVPDTLGYLRLSGLPVAEHISTAAKRFRYNRRVFIAPPWPGIFTQDQERKQTSDEAERTYHALAGVYVELGYELVPLPLAPVETRLRFVLAEAGLK
ncbi:MULTISPECIES: AAA family ATPase [unclassified Mesorhizobium]|uniref:AAA family ATPase n=1 Tax=unclassified Mesorhizobium TaxID=325217 RepID=UPI000BAE93FC|nr:MULTISPECIES: AAA family ATPase [unclassified Mesorhizobium]PBB24837.1 ATPase [Mesorhizobium sp. WSM4304]PBB74132.1 ATPase [Mesorhizobium sp. WSM4308]